MTYTLVKLAFKVSDMANKASSDYLMSLCHSTYFHYVDDLVLVYAIVKADFDTSVIKNFPEVKYDFEFNGTEEEAQYQIDVLNGVIEPRKGELPNACMG